MDPVRVRAEARSRGVEGEGDVHAWVAAAEVACGGAPEDRALAALLLALDDEARLASGTPAVVAGVRRESLVRCDAISATWAGTSVADGAPVLVRAPRHDASPVARRVLARELARVAPVVGGRLEDGGAAVVVPVRGWPAAAVHGPALARAVASALGALRRWRERVGADPEVADEELRATADGLVLVALTPTDEETTAAAVARLVDPDDPGELAVDLRAALAAEADADELEAVLRARMRDDLVARRHVLAARWRSERRRWTAGRLLHAVRRLEAALPPPAGRGAVGVDLEGAITVLDATPERISMGDEVVWDPAVGLRPAAARRLLRLRASAVPNPVLDARIGGSPGLVDTVCRWVAAGLKVRTTRLLLEAER